MYLNEKLKSTYDSQGFVIIKNFFKSSDIKILKKKVIKKVKNINSKNIYSETINGKKVRLRRVEKITENIQDVKKLLHSKKIKHLLKYITNKHNILFKDKLNFKYPGGQGFRPHIDGHFYWKDKKNKKREGWSEYSDTFTNLVIPLEDSDKKNGCLYLSKKNNIERLGKNWRQITSKMDIFSPNIKKQYLKKFKFYPALMKTGDLLVFDWHCAHKSSKNNSKRSRLIFYATYCPKNNFKNLRKQYYYDKENSKNPNYLKSLQTK